MAAFQNPCKQSFFVKPNVYLTEQFPSLVHIEYQ